MLGYAALTQPTSKLTSPSSKRMFEKAVLRYNKPLVFVDKTLL